VPNIPQSLFVADVVELDSVLDFGGLDITTANSSLATNVTSRYTLDTGQRDSFYDHASIKLKPGFSAPSGPLLVKFDHFDSSGAGFFTVDSYVGYDYGSIPSYTAQATGQVYQLRDSLDYRPVRSTPTSAATANTVSFDVDSTTTGPKIPENGSDILLDYQYYLPRIDKVILNKNRTFEVVEGDPSLTPVVPNDKDGAMTLYILREAPFLSAVSDIDVEYIDNKRYTMRDIGRIEDRVKNLEYYTTLNLLEKETNFLQIQDGDGLGSDVFYTIGQMNTFSGTSGDSGSITEYTSADGYTNRAWITQLNDIVVRNTNLNNGAPNGARVLVSGDILDGGVY
jgi:hypothetical protein